MAIYGTCLRSLQRSRAYADAPASPDKVSASRTDRTTGPGTTYTDVERRQYTAQGHLSSQRLTARAASATFADGNSLDELRG